MAKKKKTPKKSIRKPSRPAAKPAKKPAAKSARKTPAKRAPAKKTPAKKVPAKKTPGNALAKKAVPAKVAAKHAAPAKSKAAKPAGPLPKPLPFLTLRKAPPPAKTEAKKIKPAKPFRKAELAYFRTQLQTQLELIQGNLNALAGDNLKRSPLDATGDISSHSTHMADHGTDNFDRELALNLASSRQDSLYDIEDAIRRVDEGTYGACEACGCAIELPRLKALPFAKKCMTCQNAAERGRTVYRPFSGTLPLQQLAAEDAAAESPDSLG